MSEVAAQLLDDAAILMSDNHWCWDSALCPIVPVINMHICPTNRSPWVNECHTWPLMTCADLKGFLAYAVVVPHSTTVTNIQYVTYIIHWLVLHCHHSVEVLENVMGWSDSAILSNKCAKVSFMFHPNWTCLFYSIWSGSHGREMLKVLPLTENDAI